MFCDENLFLKFLTLNRGYHGPVTDSVTVENMFYDLKIFVEMRLNRRDFEG